tara:strand:+ start:441 stop:569 length:129 start_codon:yes stop_codon:yes gene_type:complete
MGLEFLKKRKDQGFILKMPQEGSHHINKNIEVRVDKIKSISL